MHKVIPYLILSSISIKKTLSIILRNLIVVLYAMYYLIKMKCSFVTSMGQINKSDSPTGIEPITSQIPVGRCNHGETLVSCSRPFTRISVLHSARISNVESVMCVINIERF